MYSESVLISRFTNHPRQDHPDGFSQRVFHHDPSFKPLDSYVVICLLNNWLQQNLNLGLTSIAIGLIVEEFC